MKTREQIVVAGPESLRANSIAAIERALGGGEVTAEHANFHEADNGESVLPLLKDLAKTPDLIIRLLLGLEMAEGGDSKRIWLPENGLGLMKNIMPLEFRNRLEIAFRTSDPDFYSMLQAIGCNVQSAGVSSSSRSKKNGGPNVSIVSECPSLEWHNPDILVKALGIDMSA